MPGEQALSRDVCIPVGGDALAGSLVVPEGASGVTLFAHGSGSSRLSPRNQFVARVLQRAGIATLLFDLLTRDEEERDAVTREHRFDIALLSRRLIDATSWIDAQPELRGFGVGYFGASTGSAAALVAAAELGARVRAVVSRGGRPDLAGDDALGRVRAATLLIVGSRDEEVLRLNEYAYARLAAKKDLAVVRGASHLFEEPGTLEEAASLAARWLRAHLVEHRGQR